MAGCKNISIMKYYSKFLVSNIFHINFIACIKNYHCKHSELDFLSRNINNSQHTHNVSIHFWQNINKAFSNTFLNSGNILEIFQRQSWGHTTILEWNFQNIGRG